MQPRPCRAPLIGPHSRVRSPRSFSVGGKCGTLLEIGADHGSLCPRSRNSSGLVAHARSCEAERRVYAARVHRESRCQRLLRVAGLRVPAVQVCTSEGWCLFASTVCPRKCQCTLSFMVTHAIKGGGSAKRQLGQEAPVIAAESQTCGGLSLAVANGRLCWSPRPGLMAGATGSGSSTPPSCGAPGR